MKIGDKIKKLRISQNLTQAEFAEKFDVSYQSVQKWENGTAKPDFERLVSIARYFDVSLDALVMDYDLRAVENMHSKTLLPDYDSIHAWELYSSAINIEFKQSVDEGLDIGAQKDLFESVSAMNRSDYKEKIADVLFEMVLNSKISNNFTYIEPNDIESIRKNRSINQSPVKSVTSNDLKEKITGAWYGRICGCLLGKPIEGIKTDELVSLLKKTDNYPMRRYITASEITDEQCFEYKFNFKGKCYADSISCAPSDDDTNYTVLYQNLIEKYGFDFSSDNILEMWVAKQPKDAYCTAERVAFCNYVKGYRAPATAEYKNPYREWIGAQIRADYFGYVNAGNPEKAAELAWRDARISHVKNGIYGEMFVAAMLAWAAVCDDMEEIISAGLSQIPCNSRLHCEISEILEQFNCGANSDKCLKYIHDYYNERDAHHWCHTISNAAIVTWALLYGENNFGNSICMAVQAGLDTDCNGATVGSVLGMKNGIGSIGSQWTAPVNGRLKTQIFGIGEVEISALIDKTLQHISCYNTNLSN